MVGIYRFNFKFIDVPSVRVLVEGCCEADFNMMHHSLPTRFPPEVENTLVQNVLALVRQPHAAAR